MSFAEARTAALLRYQDLAGVLTCSKGRCQQAPPKFSCHAHDCSTTFSQDALYNPLPSKPHCVLPDEKMLQMWSAFACHWELSSKADSYSLSNVPGMARCPCNNHFNEPITIRQHQTSELFNWCNKWWRQLFRLTWCWDLLRRQTAAALCRL